MTRQPSKHQRHTSREVGEIEHLQNQLAAGSENAVQLVQCGKRIEDKSQNCHNSGYVYGGVQDRQARIDVRSRVAHISKTTVGGTVGCAPETHGRNVKTDDTVKPVAATRD
jgi:hypothetical protein